MRLVVFIALACLAICQPGFAQTYPGGSGGTTGATTPGMPGYTPPSGGYKANPALIGGLIGGGAAAGAGIWYFMHHRNIMRGCVGDDGKTLIREKDGQSFQLSEKLQPGERVALKTKKDENSSTLQVEDIAKDYGRCEAPANGK